MADHVYDAHKQRCVSHNDLYRLFSDDGPTRANLLCLIDCLHFGFHKKDTFQPVMRAAKSSAPASHDSVVTEVMARIGPAIGDQIAAAMSAALANFIPPAPGPTGPVDPALAGGNGGGGNGDDAAIMESPPVPAGYGHPTVRQPSEVYGAADEVNPEDFKGGLSLSENTTDLKPQPQPVPLTIEELAEIRGNLKKD